MRGLWDTVGGLGNYGKLGGALGGRVTLWEVVEALGPSTQWEVVGAIWKLRSANPTLPLPSQKPKKCMDCLEMAKKNYLPRSYTWGRIFPCWHEIFFVGFIFQKQAYNEDFYKQGVSSICLPSAKARSVLCDVTDLYHLQFELLSFWWSCNNNSRQELNLVGADQKKIQLC